MHRYRWLLLLIVFCTVNAHAEPRLKVGMLAPKGSVFYRAAQSIGANWRSAHESKARFTIYPSGGQGGERSMVKRMRLGQLHGAMLTVFGLSDIEPGVAALQNIPLAYRSWQEVDHVREATRAELARSVDFRLIRDSRRVIGLERCERFDTTDHTIKSSHTRR